MHALLAVFAAGTTQLTKHGRQKGFNCNKTASTNLLVFGKFVQNCACTGTCGSPGTSLRHKTRHNRYLRLQHGTISATPGRQPIAGHDHRRAAGVHQPISRPKKKTERRPQRRLHGAAETRVQQHPGSVPLRKRCNNQPRKREKLEVAENSAGPAASSSSRKVAIILAKLHHGVVEEIHS